MRVGAGVGAGGGLSGWAGDSAGVEAWAGAGVQNSYSRFVFKVRIRDSHS